MIRTTRRTNAGRVKSVCIKNDWYGRGTNEEYENLLINIVGWSDKESTDELLETVAKDIMEHSDMNYRASGLTEEEMLVSVVFELANNACTTFVDYYEE